MVAAAVIFPRMREVSIEDLLLFGRQDIPNLPQSIPEQFMPFVIEILPHLHHFEPRVAKNVADLIALGRRQIEFEIHSLNQP